jgi:holo-[acyl-carrier protein] synthase
MRVGVDLVQISRITRTYQRFGDRFLHRAYHPNEIKEVIELEKRNPARVGPYLASRWAVKEAVFKAVNAERRCRVPFPAIYLSKSESGSPVLARSESDWSTWQDASVSLSHDGDYAIASVILSFPR